MKRTFFLTRLAGLMALLALVWMLAAPACSAQNQRVVPGDEQPERYLPLLTGKRVALFTNHTGQVDGRHILDILLEQGVEVTAIFAPEHGFRGNADAGEHVEGGTDKRTGVPILSLYDGKTRKPSAEAMAKFDALAVDIQDVGTRFYTYYITLCRLMDACAERGKEVIILDRPNPNGHYVDGPVLDMRLKSGVGWLPIPLVHGMTLGELAGMVNGEGWLPQGRQCKLTVVPCLNYTHHTPYRLPVPPSPNLPDMKSIYLYPSTCLFEGTKVSLGRGTDKPFQVYGHPDMRGDTCTFTPRSRPGAKRPPLMGKTCRGTDLSHASEDSLRRVGLTLAYVIDAYRRMGCPKDFFTPFFDRLTGAAYVRTLIVQGHTADEIAARWRKDVERFKEKRKKYLIYEN